MVSRRTFCKMLGLGAVAAGAGFDPLGLLKVSTAEASPINITGTTSTVARHAMTGAAYQQEFERLGKLGYSITYVSGYNDGGQARFNGIWDKFTTPPNRVSFHGLTNAQYQQQFTKLTADGYWPLLVNGYGIGGADFYTAIFEKSNAGGPVVARHGLTNAQYQQEFGTLSGQGFRLHHVSGYTVNNQDRYAAVWIKVGGGALVARHGLTGAQYQQQFDEHGRAGFELTRVSGYMAGGVERYAGVWEKVTPGRAWVAAHGLTAAQYQQRYDELGNQGMRPVLVNGYDVGGQARFAAIFVRPAGASSSPAPATPVEKAIDPIVEKYMKADGTVGLSVAVAQNGRLVFAKGYGLADQSANKPVTSVSRFRIASVSKPITSIAVLKLVEDGKLGLDDLVFGKDGILGTTYGTKTYNSHLTQVTVRHLLQHTVGNFNWSNAEGAEDPMFLRTSDSTDALLTWILDNRPLGAAPGATHRYSNVTYCLLGRIIEKRSGLSYADYVKRAVLDPSGVKHMTIAGNTLADRQIDEVKYHSGNAYSMNVSRMDAHGGWVASPADLLRVLTHVDSLAAPADILKASSITTMTTGPAVNAGYGMGWIVNNGAGEWGHNGSLPGTRAWMTRFGNGFSAAILANSDAPSTDNLNTLMREIVNSGAPWPAGNLF